MGTDSMKIIDVVSKGAEFIFLLIKKLVKNCSVSHSNTFTALMH